MTNSKLDILIVGNGISGPVMAMALQKATRHNVVLVDAGPEDAKPIGSSVGVTPNGIKALKFIGAEHLIQEKGGPFTVLIVGKGPSGTVLAEQNVKEIFEKNYGYPGYGIQRQELCKSLRDLAKERNIDMRYNMRLSKIEENDSVVKAHFENGQTMTADLLIGCDGIHSVTRAYVLGDDSNPRFAGASVILGLTKVTPEEVNDAGIKPGFHAWTGHGTVFGCYPCSPDGIWGWFNVFPSKDPAGGEAGWNKNDHSAEQFTKMVEGRIGDWKATFPSLLISKPIRAFPVGLYDRPPIPKWHKGRVILCGDASHATTPIGGQGAQMASESAVILARLLAEHPPSDELFGRYVKLRRPRTDAVTGNSGRALNNLLADGLWEIIRDTGIYLLGGFFIRSGMMGLIDYDAGTAPLDS
ncbi:FAD/NAD(P)-binding domain-containing protein [Serendipita vermifera]|nr:FAD/NAD(P)-binding domain-containing protein [Serendipita vermifera]